MIINSDKLIKYSVLLLILLFIYNCNGYKAFNIYIPLQYYSEEEQKIISDFLIKNQNQTITKIIIDYYNLREIIRVINK